MEMFGSADTTHKLLYVVGGVLVSAITFRVVWKMCFKEKKKEWPRDTVIHHQVGRGPYAPSLTPFAVKLETYLKMTNIPYENVHGFNQSSKGKVPWIEYNGEAVADTNIIIQFLNKKLGVNLNKNLSPAERGVALSLKCLTEDHLYWILVLYRWIYDNEKTLLLKSFKLPRLVLWQITRKVKNQVWSQGTGRHTKAEVADMLKADLQAISDILGKKKFFFGDEACEVDASVFGMLSQVYWQFKGTGHDTILQDQYPTLAAYCERMKTRFWPDWDECITHGWTREATK